MGRALTLPEVIAEAATLLADLDTSAAPTLSPPAPVLPAGLSEREVEVLRQVARGLTNAKAADRLFISPPTVDAHLRRIYEKLGVSTRAEAVRFAIEHGLA